MMSCCQKMNFVCWLAIFLSILALVSIQFVRAPVAHASYHLNSAQFHGVNWADPRDNYANDPVVPSGLSASDSYKIIYAKAKAIVKGFATNLGANTVRLPINQYTVNGPFWKSYTGAIDAATSVGFKVILSYWEGIPHRGKVGDIAAFWTMWKTVTTKYAKNGLVYFEPMNEPFGYSPSDWANLAAQWLNRYSSLPRNRVFISGTGYNDNITSVCADRRLNGTYLSLHHYGFWNSNMVNLVGWASDFAKHIIKSCVSRMVLDEWGAPMTTGLNYSGSTDGNNFVSYMQADAAMVSFLKIGSVYWPGLRTGDSYSMETLKGSGTVLSLSNNNASGVALLKISYGNTLWSISQDFKNRLNRAIDGSFIRTILGKK
jgi:endoglucanase